MASIWGLANQLNWRWHFRESSAGLVSAAYLTVDSHVTIVRPAAENMTFYIGLWGTQHEREIESLHTGSTGQTELPRDRVKALELLLPDKETLNRFNALIAPMAATIVSNQEENNRLVSIRDALLPRLMSGEIDVSAIQI